MQAPSGNNNQAASDATGVAREIGKRGPFSSREHETFINLVRAHEAAMDPVRRLLREHGLSSAHYNILRILRGHAEDPASREAGGLAVQRIAQHMLTREPDMTRLIDRLEKLGLVSRDRSTTDRRVVLVRIEPEGARLASDLEPAIDRLHREQFAHMEPEDVSRLNGLLFKAR
ncbi:MAG: MarR family transcriptional regulator, partial [Planctomycetota bacterium]